jgi:hypothetical protein
MVYPADDTVLRLKLLTQEVRRLAESVKETASRARESVPPPPPDETTRDPSIDATRDDPLAAVRRAAADSTRRPP